MDAVDRDKFARITRVSNGYDAVVAGIRAAKRAGLEPVKVNAVILRGFNEDQIVPFAHFSRDEGVIVRFIEFMPLEEDRIWSPDVVVGFNEMLDILNSFRPLVPLPATTPGETAMRYTFDDGLGEVGIIAPVSKRLLRSLQPRPPHLRRQNPHLPLLAVRSRPLRRPPARRLPTPTSPPSSKRPSRKKKPATTSANPASSNPQEAWSTSAASHDNHLPHPVSVILTTLNEVKGRKNPGDLAAARISTDLPENPPVVNQNDQLITDS